MGHNLPSSFLQCAFILKVNSLSKMAVKALDKLYKWKPETQKRLNGKWVSFTVEIAAFKLISKRTHTTFLFISLCNK